MNTTATHSIPLRLLMGLLLSFCLLTSCSRDGLELPIPPAISGQAFSLSTDTISLDTLPTNYVSSTYRLTIYNPSSTAIEGLSISQQGYVSRGFQVNVDGQAGTTFPNLHIAPRDSMLILIRAYLTETTSDQPELVQDSLRIQVGQSAAYYLPMRVYRQNVVHIDSLRISSDRTISSDRPLLIRRQIVVDRGATLTLTAPTRLLFAYGAGLQVSGRLVVRGESNRLVRFESVRGDRLLPHIPYRRVPGQWQGITFASTSLGNDLRYMYLSGAVTGLQFEGSTETDAFLASVDHSVITSGTDYGIQAGRGQISIVDSEISNMGKSCLLFSDGRYEIRRSTLVNLYEWGGSSIPMVLDYTDTGGAGSTSSLFVQHSVLDGARTVSVYRQTEETGGVVSLVAPSTAPRVEVRDSYLRSVNYARRFSSVVWENVLLPTAQNRLEQTYTRLGEDTSGRKDFGYDFRPLPSAVFVGLGKSAETLPPDLLGRSRNSTAFSYGAYEP